METKENNYTYIAAIHADDKITFKSFDNDEDVITLNHTMEVDGTGYVQCYTDNPEYRDSDYLFYYRDTKEALLKSALG